VPAPAFSELVGHLTEAFGQRPEAMRPIPEGFLLKTTDDFLYAFLEDPARVSLTTVQGLLRETDDRPSRLVVLSAGRIPLAFTAELVGKGATVVDGMRFRELVTGLNLGGYLGEEPRAKPVRRPAPQLPSARQLDEVVTRARTWSEWGVPALALRFYRQALELKPEFAPAKNGVGRSLLVLGLVSDAERIFHEVLTVSPENLEARLGLAAVAGASGRPSEEVAIYRKLIEEDPGRTEVRAHLVAALIDAAQWAEAIPEIEAMLTTTPEDARLRFLHGAALEKTGHGEEGRREIELSRTLGLEFETERALSQHLGLPEPERAAAPRIVVVPPGKRRDDSRLPEGVVRKPSTRKKARRRRPKPSARRRLGRPRKSKAK
jgi:tetratricopeptide (TPR) repeat protein